MVRVNSFWTEHVLPPAARRWLRRRVIAKRFRTRVTIDDRRVLALNAALRGRHTGRRAFVLGNGPSLGRVDLRPLAGEVTITMNSFAHHPILSTWKPTYYCRAEPGAAYDTPEKQRSIRELTATLDAEGYFFPLDARPIIEPAGLLPADRAYYFKSIVDLTEWPVERRGVDLADGVPFVGNTAQFGILLAIYLGCSPICLLGMDHDFLAHRSVNRHFYPATAAEVGGSDDLSRYPYEKLMRDTLREWERYAVLGRLAARHGCEIVNATEGSFLDVYPRVRYDEAVSRFENSTMGAVGKRAVAPVSNRCEGNLVSDSIGA